MKFILSLRGTVKDMATECHLRWPERDISEVNIRSVRSHYLIDKHGNVQSKHIHTRLMLEELGQNPDLLASKVRVTREAEQKQAAIQQAEKRDFEHQSSDAERSALGMQEWQSNAAPPMAAISKVMNQPREHSLIDPLNFTDTSSTQSKICADYNFPAFEKTKLQSTNTEAVGVPSSTRMDTLLPTTLTTAQMPLKENSSSLTSQQITTPMQTSIPCQDSTSFYE